MSVDGGEKNHLRVLTDLKVCQCLMMVEVLCSWIAVDTMRIGGMSVSYSLYRPSCSTGQVWNVALSRTSVQAGNESSQWDVRDPIQISILLLYISHSKKIAYHTDSLPHKSHTLQVSYHQNRMKNKIHTFWIQLAEVTLAPSRIRTRERLPCSRKPAVAVLAVPREMLKPSSPSCISCMLKVQT